MKVAPNTNTDCSGCAHKITKRLQVVPDAKENSMCPSLLATWSLIQGLAMPAQGQAQEDRLWAREGRWHSNSYTQML